MGIDPNGTVKDWDLVMNNKRDPKPNPESTSAFDWNTVKGKRAASSSPEERTRKRNNREEIDDWQIAEYIHAFLEGTATKPKYTNINWSKDAAPVAEENDPVEEAEETPVNARTDPNQITLSK